MSEIIFMGKHGMQLREPFAWEDKLRDFTYVGEGLFYRGDLAINVRTLQVVDISAVDDQVRTRSINDDVVHKGLPRPNAERAAKMDVSLTHATPTLPASHVSPNRHFPLESCRSA
ncbi:MAG: hypothetical protein Q4A01_09890 [Coriobacteriales bacterium]|nr:hypothetical protein [Coriobacteriales bacterium]